MRLIVTGAGSFLGSALLLRLSEEENAGTEKKQNGAAQRISITAFRHSFEEAPSRLPEAADAWVHFAWAGAGSAGRSDRSIQDYNQEMSMAALGKAAKLGCTRFLFAGSQAEYGRAALKGGLQDETAVCMPVSEYGRAKLLFGQRAARFCASWNEDDTPQRLRFIHLRFFSVYGNGDHPGSLIESCIRNFSENREMALGPCTQDWDYLYIDDAVDALRALLHSETAEGIYNVASGDIRPLSSYVRELHALLQSKSSLRFGARGNNAEGAVPLRPSVERLQAETGFLPRFSFADGIRKMLEERSRHGDSRLRRS